MRAVVQVVAAHSFSSNQYESNMLYENTSIGTTTIQNPIRLAPEISKDDLLTLHNNFTPTFHLQTTISLQPRNNETNVTQEAQLSEKEQNSTAQITLYSANDTILYTGLGLEKAKQSYVQTTNIPQIVTREVVKLPTDGHRRSCTNKQEDKIKCLNGTCFSALIAGQHKIACQ